MARVALTKSETGTEAGASLLALCRSVTSDGRLTAEDLRRIVAWRREHGDSELPSARYLSPIIDRVLVDGRVTREEQTELLKALEAVLPPELRRGAVAARRGAEDARRLRDKEAKAAQLERERETQRAIEERNREVGRFDVMLVEAGESGRQARIRRLREGALLSLERDPTNARVKSGASIRVLAPGIGDIGFVPAADAIDLSRLLDTGHRYIAQLKRVLDGNPDHIRPVVVISVRPPEADLEALEQAAIRDGQSRPERPERPRSTGNGPAPDWAPPLPVPRPIRLYAIAIGGAVLAGVILAGCAWLLLR